MLAFIGIAVPEPYSRRLSRIKQQHQPKATSLEPHLTLLPPGNLTVGLNHAIAQFKSIKFEPVTIKTAGIGGKRRRGGAVIWMEVEPNRELIELKKHLMGQLSGKIISSENHNHEFKPHLPFYALRRRLIPTECSKR